MNKDKSGLVGRPRFTLGLRIGLGFGIGAAVTAAVGLVGIVGIGRMSATIEKTATATAAFVAMNDVTQSFAKFAASQDDADAKLTLGKIAVVRGIMGRLETGRDSVEKANSALTNLEENITKISKNNASMAGALSDIESNSYTMTASISQIAADAMRTIESVTDDEKASLQSIKSDPAGSVSDLLSDTKKLVAAKDMALLGQHATETVSNLIIATKDFLAKGGKTDPKLVINQIDTMVKLAKDTDAAGQTAGVADIIESYRDAFKAVTDVMQAKSALVQSADQSATTSVSSIAALASEIVDEAASTTSSVRLIALAALLLAGVITAFFAAMTVRSVRSPITALTKVMFRLAEGDTNVTAPGVSRSDEIGEMSRTVTTFRDAAIEKRRLEADAEQGRQTSVERQRRVEAMIADFRSDIEQVLANLADRSSRMQGTAERLSSAADRSQSQVQSANTASTAASQNVTTVAAAAEELTASIHEISTRVERTVEVVGLASGQATDSNARIAGLAKSATRIGDVVKLIRSIADQTNLLALNATIEAARAGDAGKGFAVVAAEVKQLADQTAKATQDIANQVDGIQSSTQLAVNSIGEIAMSMRTVNDYTSSIATAVGQQGVATTEISQNAQSAAVGTEAVTDSMITLVQMAMEATKSADEVSKVAQEVSEANQILNRTMNTFIQNVTAA